MNTGQFDRFLGKKLKGFFFIGLSLFLFSHCSQDADIREYYFPLKELEEGMVYEYQPVEDDSLPTIYWYYRSFIYPDSIFLTGTRYSPELLPEQFTREELVDNGMLTVDSYVYETDSTGKQRQIPVDILAGSSFPFEVSEEGGIFLHRLRWASVVEPGVSYEVVKNRRYLGDTAYSWNGHPGDAVILELREAIDQNAEGTLSLESEGVEIYQEDVGLVYFRKRFESGFTVEYALAERYTMDELEAKFGEMYGEE